MNDRNKLQLLTLATLLALSGLALGLARGDRAAGQRAALAYDGTVVAVFEVEDLAASLEWYRKHLGFEKLLHAEAFGWAEVATNVPGAAIGLWQPQEPSGRKGSIGLGVKDVAAASAHLAKGGLSREGEVAVLPGLVKLATFRDPSGNTILLAESLGE